MEYESNLIVIFSDLDLKIVFNEVIYMDHHPSTVDHVE